jgi:hypothetical protein
MPKPGNNFASLCITCNACNIGQTLILHLTKWLNLVLHRFATLATRMEQYIQGQSRDLADQAHTKFVSSLFLNVFFFCFLSDSLVLFFIAPLFSTSEFYIWEVIWQVSIMFVTLEKIAQTDPKYADVFLLENYAAFQNRYSFLSFLSYLGIFPKFFE